MSWPGLTKKKTFSAWSTIESTNLINNLTRVLDQQNFNQPKWKALCIGSLSYTLFWQNWKSDHKKKVQRFFKSSKPPTLSVTCADMINFFNEESYNVMDFLLAISSRKRKKLQHNNVMDFLLAISSRKRKKLQHRNEILWTTTIHVIWTPTRILEKKRRTKTLSKQSASMYPWVFS